MRRLRSQTPPWQLAGELAWKIRPYVPLTALNVVWHNLAKETQTILDIGCGKGEPMKFINRRRLFKAVGVDTFMPYLAECKKLGVYDECVRCDICALPFKRKSFDLIICMSVLEHLDKNDGTKLIKDKEQIAREQTIVSVPRGLYEQHSATDGNPAQIHKSTWHPKDLTALGYKVRGQSLPIYGESGPITYLPQCLRWLGYVLYALASPITYFFPGLSGNIVATKRYSRRRA